MGEITVGKRGVVTYKFLVSNEIIPKARFSEIYINQLCFNGKRENAIAKINVGKSTLFFIQNKPSPLPAFLSNKSEQIIDGFIAEETWQKSNEPKITFQPEKSSVKLSCELLSPEMLLTIEVSEMQEIVIHSIELKIWYRNNTRSVEGDL
ncbi:hypothetical protein ACFLRN_02755 [Thermoproteota archaeon]